MSSQPSQTTPRRGWIDVHHHIAPAAYLRESGEGVGRALKTWSLAKSIEDLEEGGIATAILSVTQLSKHINNDAQRRSLARACNDEAARIVADHPGRFGMFAVLPLPDIEGSLKEIEYGLDRLKADGVGMYTCYHDKWLGDPLFDPVFAELDRRKAVIYVHPSIPDCCRNLVPGVADAAIEFGTDTTRAITRMVFSGASRRFPNLRIIWSHAGGTMPYLIERFVRMAQQREFAKLLPQGFMPEARRFFYDTAQVANHTTLACAREVVPNRHFVFGSDFPYRTSREHVEGLETCGVFNSAELDAIARGTVARLLPRYVAANH
ncbi:MAG TPA: amidohydrolase family protein [Stellaceae bacterium]|nr:amidohydrolase family protein [Stellaceae bacterium]